VTWNLELCDLELGTWNLGLELGDLELGTWCLEPGTCNLAACNWDLEPGTWITHHSKGLGSVTLERGD
jgi:hypothetical protein